MPPPVPTPAAVAPDAGTGSVTCVVVNWNGAAHTLACLGALALQTHRRLQVIAVDNGSTDDSAGQIEAWLKQHAATPNSLPMRLLRTGANLGFAGGNNAGIRSVAAPQPEFFWLLNNDTLPPPDTLAQLIAQAAAEPTAGLVGTVLRYAHDPARVQAWGGGHIDPTTAYATHFTAPHVFGYNDYLTFASVLMRTSMLQQVGMLDERFFMYFEDAELCLRAQRAGWSMTVAPGTAVLHHEGGSTAAGSRSLAQERTTTASALLLIRLHGPHPLGAAVFLLRRVAKRLLQGKLQAARAILQTALQRSH